MNNKGFMMAEVVVVSAIILVFLAGLYTSYNKLYSVYTSRLDYYDSVTLYRLGYYRDYLIEVGLGGKDLNGLIGELNTKDSYKKVFNYDSEKVYLIRNEKKDFNNDIVKEENLTFKDYVTFLNDAEIEFKANYLMIMERCISSDDCKYAYLEVYDGNE